MRHLRHFLPVAAAIVALNAAPALAQGDPLDLINQQEPVVAGALVITQAWSRATPPGAPTAAGYLAIANNGTAPDRLLAVTSPVAAIGQLHEMAVIDGVMTMRHLDGGLVIPAGETVVLQPGGHHLMLINLAAGLVTGTVVPVTLTFEVAGTVEISLVVFPIGSQGPAANGGTP